MPGPKHLSESKKKVRERERQALEYYRAGMTATEIAERLGYADHSAVSHMITRILERQVNLEAGEVRRAEVDRLDALLSSVWGKARRGDEKSVDAALKIMDRRRRYIGGLEVAAVSEVTLSSADIAEEAAQAAEQLSAMYSKRKETRQPEETE